METELKHDPTVRTSTSWQFFHIAAFLVRVFQIPREATRRHLSIQTKSHTRGRYSMEFAPIPRDNFVNSRSLLASPRVFVQPTSCKPRSLEALHPCLAAFPRWFPSVFPTWEWDEILESRECDDFQYSPEKLTHVPWKSKVGKCIPYWNSPFLGDVVLVVIFLNCY